MNFSENTIVRVAILDMYEGAINQGMRCLRDILNQYGELNNIDLKFEEFEVRNAKQIPDLSFDIYLSTGGPGSPIASKGSEWENLYFSWLNSVEEWNISKVHIKKKYVFFICHSFQLVCRHWDLANVCERKSTAFGVFPIHFTEDGMNEPVFSGVPNPFYAVDSRDWQVIEPKINDTYKSVKILCIEKDRPHVPFERAIMAIRFDDYFFGTQFHPEADAAGMSMYLQTEEKKKTVIDNYGIDKWKAMIESLNDPDKILLTYSHILPNFLNIAIESLQEELV